jgi:outer membrane protein assembly factor BamB
LGNNPKPYKIIENLPLLSPVGITENKNADIIVVDAGNDRLLILDPNHYFIKKIIHAGCPIFLVVVDKYNDNIWCSSVYCGNVFCFNQEGTLLKNYPIIKPTGLTIINSILFVISENKILAINTETDIILWIVGSNIPLSQGSICAFYDQIVICDTLSNTLKFISSKTGTILYSFSTNILSIPHSVFFSAHHNYFGIIEENAICLLTVDGKLIYRWINRTNNRLVNGSIVGAILFSSTKKMYLTDNLNNKIWVY